MNTFVTDMEDEGNNSYPCPFCHDKFETFSEVNFHMETHIDDILYTCSKCKYVSPDKTAVERHLNTHSQQFNVQHQAQQNHVQHQGPQNHVQHQAQQNHVQHQTQQNHVQHQTQQNHIQHQAEQNHAQHQTQQNHVQHQTQQNHVQHQAQQNHVQHQAQQNHVQHQAQQHHVQHQTQQNHVQHQTQQNHVQHQVQQNHVQHQAGTSEPKHSYLCAWCRKEFGSLLEVSIHMKTHGGEKVYKCSTCGFISGQMTIVQSHMTTHCKQGAEKESNKDNVSSLQGKQADMVYEGEFSVVDNKHALLPCLSTEHQSFTGVTGKEVDLIKTMLKKKKCDFRTHVSGNVQDINLTHNNENVNPPVVDLQSLHVPSGEIKINHHMTRHTVKKPHKCSDCDKQYTNTASLKRHMRTHTENPQQCSVWGKRFSYLRLHMMTHTGEKPHQCSVFCKKFCKLSYLSRHMFMHTGEKPNRCSICSKGSYRLHRHMKSHITENKHKSALCCKTLEMQSSSKLHLVTHKGESPHLSTVPNKNKKLTTISSTQDKEPASGKQSIVEQTCLQYLSTEHNAVEADIDDDVTQTSSEEARITDDISTQVCEHGSQNDSVNSVGFPSIECSEGDGVREALPGHLQVHAPHQAVGKHGHVNKGPHECTVCRRRLTTKYKLQAHMLTHSDKKPYQCHICSKRFPRPREFKNHMMRHTGEQPHKCSQCLQSFISNSTLRTHMPTHTRPHKCSQCGRRFSQKVHLNKHMMTHTGEMLYQCSVCNKGFAESYYLHRHMRTHTGDKLYSCSLCDKQFTTQSGLKLHMSSHTDEEHHRCSLCSKRFGLSSDLSRHMMLSHRGEKSTLLTTPSRHMSSHTRAKPHQCLMCRKSFGQSSHLSRHIRTHMRKPQREKAHQCCDCGKQFRKLGDLKTHMVVHAGRHVEPCVNISADENETFPLAENTAVCVVTSKDSTSTLVHDSTNQIYQTLIQMVDKPCQYNGQTDQAVGIVVVQPESPGTMFQEPEEDRMNPYIAKISQTDKNTVIYKALDRKTFSQTLDQMTNHKLNQVNCDQIQNSKATLSQYCHGNPDLQLCSGRDMLCKDGKIYSSVDEETFPPKGQTNVQTVNTEQLPDMVDNYSSYMDGIDYSGCKMCVDGFTKAVDLEEHLEKHLAEHILMHAERM